MSLSGPQNIIGNLRSYPVRVQWIYDNAEGIADVLEEAWREGFKWKDRAMKAEDTIAEFHKLLQQGWAAPTNLLAQAMAELLEDFEEEPADV